VHLKESARRQSVRAAIARTLEGGSPLRIRARGETPFLRYGDAVMPQMLVKDAFGEFAARPRSDGRITIDPAWVARNLRRRSVPLLGRVTCHRALFPQLKGALASLEADGLGHLIDASDQAGCWVPRFIGWDPNGWISHHAWGIALDVNVSNNAFGMQPHQDPRLVARMERWGFTWGGRWLIPDGMHFEWERWTRVGGTARESG
jgi:D-alanyl-D-alanine carboxypeptidase